NKVMISRLGDRVRAAGMAELKSYRLAVDPDRVAFLAGVVREWFPQGLDLDGAQPWPGLRPMTPDGPAILGKTRDRKSTRLNSSYVKTSYADLCLKKKKKYRSK